MNTNAGPVTRLIACFDGTWNTASSNTNVSRLFRKIVDGNCGDSVQHRFYDEGVGTKWGERIRGGMFGAGLDKNIRQGYAWLGSQFPVPLSGTTDAAGFVDGPLIFLFGFSRGAFTARSLGGLINYLGLPKIDVAGHDADDPIRDNDVVMAAWTLYASRPSDEERAAAAAKPALAAGIEAHDDAVTAFRRDRAVYPVRIHFLGVWDTVGALGVPRVFDYRWIPRFSTKYQFHDTRLAPCVTYAYHAMAIDEQRAPYCVTLWTDHDRPVVPGTTVGEVEQRWFPGAHADVGGGYPDDLLPDPTLAWMADKAAACGLCFVNDRGDPDAQGVVQPPYAARRPAAFDLDGREYLSPVHDSYAEFMNGFYKLMRSLPGAGGRVYRRMMVEKDGMNQRIDATATKKMDVDPSYRPPNLAEAGRSDVNFHVAVLEAQVIDGQVMG